MSNKKLISFVFTILVLFSFSPSSVLSQSNIPTPLGSTAAWQALKEALVFADDGTIDMNVGGSILASSGTLTLGGVDGTNNENLAIDFESETNIIILSSTTSALLRFDLNTRYSDSIRSGFGNSNDAVFRYTIVGNDNFQLGLLVGSADSSGYFSIMEGADIGTSTRSPISSWPNGATPADPTFAVLSSDGTETLDILALWHDQTDPHIGWGNGSLTLVNKQADTLPILTLENTGGNFQIFRDDASPEGVITGSIGDLTIDSTGGEIYIKETGSATNTGWVEVGGGVAAFSSLWYHGVELTTNIATSTTFVQILSFENVGLEDAGGNVIGDATTDDDITINLAGTYEIEIGSSFKNASGANKNMIIASGVTLATPLVITDATNATPIVITSEDHGLLNGDMVTQSGVGGNTAANGDFFISNKEDDTYELEDLANNDIVGNGAYTSGGTVDIKYPGEVVIERVVSGNDLGRGMAEGSIALAVGDIVELYVANETDANNFITSQITMKVRREE